jgi:hypothetical protein
LLYQSEALKRINGMKGTGEKNATFSTINYKNSTIYAMACLEWNVLKIKHDSSNCS